MSTVTVSVEERVRRFVAAVGEHFSDLSVAEREELMADLEQHLTELAAEARDSLDAEMGNPAAYAAELRAGARLVSGAKRPGRLAGAVTDIGRRLRLVREDPRLEPVRRYVRMLRPTWWLVRAWAPLVLIAMTLDGPSGWARHVFVPGRNLIGFAALGLAVVLSVRAGLRGEDTGRLWRAVDFVGAGAFVIVLWTSLSAVPTETVFVESNVGEPSIDASGLLRHPDGEGITNLYVYDADGHLLRDVFVFDGAGRPVEVGPHADEWYGLQSELRVDAEGRVVGNLYPLAQYVVDLEGALRVREVPEVTIPQLPRGGVVDEEPPQQSSTTSIVEEAPPPTGTSRTDPLR